MRIVDLRSRRLLAAGFALLAYHVAAIRAAEPSLQRFEFTEVHMAVDFRIVLYAEDDAAAKQAATAAFARIKQLDEELSDYKADSELSRLSDTAPSPQPVHVSDDLWRVLAASKRVSAQTGGAFDCTVGPVVKLWRRARRNHELPLPDALAAARESVGDQYLELDAKRQAARLLKPKMRLDLGGIAKGFAADEALAVLKKRGITRALVGGSGDIAVGDPPPGATGWRIGIAPLEPKGPPSRHVVLANAAVSTSGDSMQHVEIAGKRYSHVVDPRSGMALTDHCSVSVVAPNCTTTDGLSTGLSVMGTASALKLADQLPDVAALIVRQPDSKQEALESARWRQFEDPSQKR
jgi:thiamine biosynthesis lipoprotein